MKAEAFCLQLSLGEEETGSSWSRAPIHLLANLCAEKKSCWGGVCEGKGVWEWWVLLEKGVWEDCEEIGKYKELNMLSTLKGYLIIAGRLAGAISVGINGQAPGGEVHSH